MGKRRSNRKTSRKVNKNTKILASIIVLIILVLLGVLGINNDSIEKLANEFGINLETENIANTVSNTAQNSTSQEEIQNNNSNTQVSTDLQVYYIDVGQADSILVTNQEHSMLIDAGNNEDGKEVTNFIKEKGITKLDYVIGTHPHEDHIGGLDDVINSDLEIENILMPKIQTNTKTFEDVLDAVSNKGLQITSPAKGDTFNIGEAKCEIMTDSILDKNNLNLSSIVIRLEFGSNSFLFMGDAEEENEETRSWPKTDVLKVGHHGSNTSSSESFLSQVTPKYAIIMVGEGNSYGLPKEEIISRIENTGATIYRTDEVGTIQVTSNGTDLNFNWGRG